MPASDTLFLDFNKSVTVSVVLLDSTERGVAIPDNNPVWTVDNPALVTLAPNGQVCLVTANGSMTGTATIKCTITLPVAQATTIRVVVGATPPSPRLEIWGSPVKHVPTIQQPYMF